MLTNAWLYKYLWTQCLLNILQNWETQWVGGWRDSNAERMLSLQSPEAGMLKPKIETNFPAATRRFETDLIQFTKAVIYRLRIPLNEFRVEWSGNTEGVRLSETDISTGAEVWFLSQKFWIWTRERPKVMWFFLWSPYIRKSRNSSSVSIMKVPNINFRHSHNTLLDLLEALRGHKEHTKNHKSNTSS